MIDDLSDNIDTVPIKIENEESATDPLFLTTTHHANTIDLYNQIFGAFYNIPISISPTSITNSLAHTEQLVKIATDLSCLHNLPAFTSTGFRYSAQ